MTAPLAPPDGHRLTFTGADGNTIVGDRLGPDEGWPVILAHGGGQTRHAWGGTAQALAAAGYRAISIDQRGHGQSSRSQNANYRYPDFAADLRAVAKIVRDQTGRAPAIVGASLGGLAAFLAALGDKPAPVGALVLVDITPWMNPDGVDRIMGFMTADLEDGFESLDAAAEAIAHYLPNRKRMPRLEGLAKNLVRGADGRYRWHWDPAFVAGPRAISTDYESTTAYIVENAGHVVCPVHLIRGRESDLIDEDQAQRFVQLLKNGSYADISGAGHMIAGDRNDVFTDAVLTFLGSALPVPSAILSK